MFSDSQTRVARSGLQYGLIIGQNRRLKYTCHRCWTSQPNLYGSRTMVNAVNTMANGRKTNKTQASPRRPHTHTPKTFLRFLKRDLINSTLISVFYETVTKVVMLFLSIAACFVLLAELTIYTPQYSLSTCIAYIKLVKTIIFFAKTLVKWISAASTFFCIYMRHTHYANHQGWYMRVRSTRCWRADHRAAVPALIHGHPIQGCHQ